MLYIDEDGFVDAERVIIKIFSMIERGVLRKVNGIIVHQTASATASSTFNSYRNKGANGAHFLIDKDGKIYQTASLFKVTWHVGLSQSRCFVRKKCRPTEFQQVAEMEKSWRNYRKISALEQKKFFPDRFPNNSDSIGIELVGQAKDSGKGELVFESVNKKQNDSLKWLIRELADTLNVSMTEVYRHPEIGRKNMTEASTAKW
ncbi:N-acetylmuramoyl-L-alanine amidase [Serratia rubidaea]|uniref:peptidoglycan recognition protein family protein n=1 Tax=Serratia rubidaea TaxID=61652 RepID=UPI0022B8DB44|nr:peptidoglycan recognition family protein [Serratia rubidaea]WBF47640.1 N-acetylmuramoyl-L-alanine amidase [Serratia rubidaea]